MNQFILQRFIYRYNNLLFIDLQPMQYYTYLYWIKRTEKSNTLFPSVNSLTWYAIKCQNFLACLSIMNRNKILLYLFSSLFIYIPMMTYLIKCQLFSCLGGILLGLFQRFLTSNFISTDMIPLKLLKYVWNTIFLLDYSYCKSWG